MKKKITTTATIIVAFTAIVILVGTFKNGQPTGEDNSGALTASGLRSSREQGYRERLVSDANGNLVGLTAFEANLKLDSSFKPGSPDYKKKLLINYIELALLANPQQALAYLRVCKAEWVSDSLTAPTILRQIAATLGLEAIREFLDDLPPRVLTEVAAVLVRAMKDGESQVMLDFLLSSDPTLLSNDAVMANLMLRASGDIAELAEFYRKLPECDERVHAARILAQKASSLTPEEFEKFYPKIARHLSESERREIHTTLADKMESMDDPKLAVLLTEGFVGDAEKLMSLAAKSADTNLDDALKKLDTMNVGVKDRNSLFCGIMRSWAQYAPQKAAHYAFSAYQSGEAFAEASSVVFGEWINRDTPAAVSFFNRMAMDSEMKRLIDFSHFPNVATYSMREGLGVLEERQSDSNYEPILVDQLRREFALSDGAHHSTQVVLGELAKIKDPQIKESAIYRFSAGLAGENLFKAVSLAAQSTIPSQRDQLLLGALAPALTYDVNYSHEMIRNISDPRIRDDAFMMWYDTARKLEPHLASEWLQDLKSSNTPLYDKIYK